MTSPYGDHLPIFPLLPKPVTDADIARVVGKLLARAELARLQQKATGAQFAKWRKRLDEWATELSLNT